MYDINPSDVGFYLSITPCAYLINSLIVSQVKMNKKIVKNKSRNI